MNSLRIWVAIRCWSPLRCAFLFATSAFFLAATSSGTQFKAVVSQPSAFHGKHVSLVGVAEIEGNRFTLYQDTGAASKGDVSRAVFVRQRIDSAGYDQFNNHWVEITGLLDATLHGPLGGNHACEIFLEGIHALARPPALKDTRRYLVFRNETSTLINLEVSWEGGYTKFALDPTGIDSVVLREGRVVITTRTGKPVAKGDLMPGRMPAQYYDSINRTFYYRIRKGELELVPPREARIWTKPEGDRR